MITSLLRLFSNAEDTRRLRSEIVSLRRQVSALSWDEPFGMLTRTAFLQHCRELLPASRLIAFIDLNEIGLLNHRYGYQDVDRRIRASFSMFQRSPHVAARWYSGDEIVILFAENSDPASLIERLRRAAGVNGLSFVCAWGDWTCWREPVETAIQRLSTQVETV